MRRMLSSLMLALILLSSGFLTIGNGVKNPAPDMDDPSEECQLSTNRISISGDMDLFEKALMNNWTGLGTEEKPYRIGNLTIDAGGGYYGIYVSDTESHLSIENLTISNASVYPASPGKAIWLDNVTNVTIKDISISQQFYGVFIEGSSSVEIRDSDIDGGDYTGIRLEYSSDIEISDCVFQHLSHGIDIDRCTSISIYRNIFQYSLNGITTNLLEHSRIIHNDFDQIYQIAVNLSSGEINSVEGNEIVDSYIGIYLYSTSGNRVHSNEMMRSCVFLDGDMDTYSNNSIPENNTVNSLPIKYYKDDDMENDTILKNFGQLIMFNVSNAVISNYLGNYSIEPPILAAYCSGLSFANLVMSGFSLGIFITYSDDIDISWSKFNSYNGSAVAVVDSHDIVIRSSVFQNNTRGVFSIETIDVNYYDDQFYKNEVGLKLRSCVGGSINRTSFENNYEFGLLLDDTTDYVVSDSFFENNARGAECFVSDQNIFSENTFNNNNRTGLAINESKYCIIQDNEFDGNDMGGLLIYRSYYLDVYSNSFISDGIDMDIANLFDTVNIPTNNTINGLPIYFYSGGDQLNSVVPDDAGQVILGGISSLRIESIHFSYVYRGIISLLSQQVTMKNLSFTYCIFGIYMTSSSGCEVSQSRFYKCDYGIFATDPYQLSTGYLVMRSNNFWNIDNIPLYIEKLDYCMIGENRFESLSDFGVILHECGGFDLTGNSFSGVDIGVILNRSYDGDVIGNTFYNGEYGIILKAICSGITIDDNLFLLNGFNAISIEQTCSTDNSVSLNAFIENGNGGSIPQVYDPVGIDWSVDEMGNFWDNHTSPDNDQNGIVDVPIYLDGGVAVDNYPLSTNPVKIITPPLNPTAMGGRTNIELTWDPSSYSRDGEVPKYMIYIGEDPEHMALYRTVSGDVTSYDCRKLDGGTHYHFHIIAQNIYGDSTPSTMVDAWTDITPPTIDILQPNDKSHVNSADITLRWEISDLISGVGITELYLDEELIADVTGLGWYDINDLPDGHHQITIDTEDNVGNSNRSTILFTVDTVQPTVEITGDPVLITRDPNVVVQWTGSDEIGIYRYEYRLNNGTWNSVDTNSEHLFVEMVDGYYWFDVRAVDQAGNTAVDSLEIYVDTTPPEVRVTSPEYGSYVDNQMVIIKWVSSDEITRIDHFLIYFDGGEPKFINGIDRQFTQVVSEGGHEVVITSFDLAGNRMIANTLFILDTVPPEVVNFWPSGVDVPVNSEIKINVSEEMREDSVGISVSGLVGTMLVRDDGYYFEYTGSLFYNWTYTVTVSGEDLAGNNIVPVNWTFRTIDQAWVGGKVIDQYGDPVIDAAILINGVHIGTTSNLGNFHISLGSGTYEVAIIKFGYTNWSGDVNLIPGEDQDLGEIVVNLMPTVGGDDGPEENGDGNGPFPIWIIIVILVMVLLIIAAAFFVYFNVIRSEAPIEKIKENYWERADRMRRLAEYHEIDIGGIDKIYRNAEFNKGLGKINHATDEIKEYNHSLADILQEFSVNPETSVEEIEKAFDMAKEREFEMLMDESLDMPNIEEFNVVAESKPPDGQDGVPPADVQAIDASDAVDLTVTDEKPPL